MHRFQRAVFDGRRIDWRQMSRNTNRLQALRVLQYTTIHDCTLEAIRTQASPDLCAESKWLIAFNCNSHKLHLSKLNRATLVQHCALGTVISIVSYSLLLFARTV